jgi:hypothetical protein
MLSDLLPALNGWLVVCKVGDMILINLHELVNLFLIVILRQLGFSLLVVFFDPLLQLSEPLIHLMLIDGTSGQNLRMLTGVKLLVNLSVFFSIFEDKI